MQGSLRRRKETRVIPGIIKTIFIPFPNYGDLIRKLGAWLWSCISRAYSHSMRVSMLCKAHYAGARKRALSPMLVQQSHPYSLNSRECTFSLMEVDDLISMNLFYCAGNIHFLLVSVWHNCFCILNVGYLPFLMLSLD